MKYLSAFFLLLIIASCKKTDPELAPEFPSTLYLNSITQKSKIRLFSDRKEITDNGVIARFLKSSGGLKLKDSSFVSEEHIKFYSADSAEIPNSFSSLIVRKNENQLLFKSTNRIITTKDAIEHSFNMAKYRSEVEPVWDSKFSTYRMLIGYGNFSELKLSVFEYSRVVWNTKFSSDYFLFPSLFRSSSLGIMFNEFDEAYVKSISKNDTLAIQEYFYSFKKR